MQLTCNRPFEPGLFAIIKVKKTNLFLTASQDWLREPKTVGSQVKKVGKEFKVNLSNSEMSFLTNTHSPVLAMCLVYLQLILVQTDDCRLVANNPG